MAVCTTQPEKIPVEPDLDNASVGSVTFSNPQNNYAFKENFMRKILFLSVVLCAFFVSYISAGGTGESTKRGAVQKQLVIYAYDSFVSQWGTGPKVIPVFEKKYGIKVTVQSAGDAGQVLQKAIMEKDNPSADILIGIDNNLLAKALREDIFAPYKPEGITKVPKALLFDPSYRVIPYDYGFFSIIYDSTKITHPPRSLEDLCSKRFKKSLILMDPRTSSPGLGFLLWTIAAYGDSFPSYWERLRPSILTITAGWDAGYGLFTSGEAPMVLSYTTSPAYHVEYEHTKRYLAAPFTKGNYMQIEGLGIVKNAPHRKAAELFVQFSLSKDFQKEIPLTNWMYPVSKGVTLPDSFSYAPIPAKRLMLPSALVKDHLDSWLTQWTDAASK